MKATLVVDMPKKCVECSLANRDNIVEFCKITGKEIPIIFSSNEEYEEIRNDDCPLKPMPQKKEDVSYFISSTPMAVLKGFNEGYNTCIDEILGEKDESIIKGYCKDCKFFMNNFVKEELDATDYEDIVCTYHMADGFTSYDYCSMFVEKGEKE